MVRRGAKELLTKKGLPTNVDAERFVLGSILLNDSLFVQAVGTLEADDFSLEKHRRIFKRMGEMNERGERIDRVTVANELMKFGELEACDGLSYLVSLDDGIPQIPKLDGYIHIVKDKADQRRLVFIADELMQAALLESGTPGEILEGHRKRIEEMTIRSSGTCSIDNIPCIEDCDGAEISYLFSPLVANGCIMSVTGDRSCGKTTLMAWIAGAVSGAQVSTLILDRENPVSSWKERLCRLGIRTGPHLQIWGGWRERPAPSPNDSELIEWVRRTTPKPFIIFDSKSAFFDGDDENDAAQTRAFFQQLRRLADLGAAIGLIAHSGKAETARDFRGSSDFGQAIDAGWA
jgi:hypothetical protein